MNIALQSKLDPDNKKYSRKGRERIAKILESASQLLVEQGMEDFSVNKVAARAGISLGNLQYYFPRKKDLLFALLQSQLGPAQERVRAVADTADCDKQLLRDIVGDALGMNLRDDTCAAVWTTVAMALYDPEMKSLADWWYSLYRDIITETVVRYNPDLEKDQIPSVVLTIMSAIEGHALIWRHTVPGPRQRQAAIRGLIANIELLIDSRAANPSAYL